MNRRTLRGQLIEGTSKRLIVDDGRFNHGYKVVRFVVSGEPTSAGNDCWATLALDYDAPQQWDWGDNRQIGWAATNVTASPDAPFSVIDPDHIVVTDLYIQGRVGSSAGESPINYLIELEPVTMSDDQAILALIKERSQDDLR